jgi:hypothetical protein
MCWSQPLPYSVIRSSTESAVCIQLRHNENKGRILDSDFLQVRRIVFCSDRHRDLREYTIRNWSVRSDQDILRNAYRSKTPRGWA